MFGLVLSSIHPRPFSHICFPFTLWGQKPVPDALVVPLVALYTERIRHYLTGSIAKLFTVHGSVLSRLSAHWCREQ